MVPEYRREFNARFTQAKYQQFLEELSRRSGSPVTFRNSETPCFFPREIIDKMVTAGNELLQQLSTPEYHKLSDASIPPQFSVPNESAHPLFVQADFGLDQNLEPKLVEIQGFPSLYALQPVAAETYRDIYELERGLRYFLSYGDYWTLLRRAIVGNCDP